MDEDGTISGNLDAVYNFINSVRPEIRPECVAPSVDMETETATTASGYCACRNRDLAGSCNCGLPRDPKETEFDIVSEPSPKVHKGNQNDVLDIQTPFDPEIQSTEPGASCDQFKPVTYEPISMSARPDAPLGAGQEIEFHRSIAVPRGQVAVEFLPWLPRDHPKVAVPPIFRWAAIIHHHPDDPPLKSPAQRRQIFQQAIKKVPYSRSVRGRDYMDRGVFEWSIALGYVLTILAFTYILIISVILIELIYTASYCTYIYIHYMCIIS